MTQWQLTPNEYVLKNKTIKPLTNLQMFELKYY